MTTIRAATEDDVERILALASQAFNINPSSHDRIRKEMKLETYRVLERDGTVMATARYIPFGHLYGGRAIRAAGIASVAVAAEARGKGYGSAIVHELLRELRADGYPLSSLYPATAPIYKTAGYGFGAIRTSYKVPLNLLPDRARLQVEPFELAHLDEVNEVYLRFAATQNGLVDRPRDWWERRVFVDWEGRDYYRYLVREDGRVAGWMIYRLGENRDGWRSIVECRDLMWSSPDAARALLALAALHRSTSETLAWVGPPSDPLADLLPEDVMESESSFRTMVRLLDVPAAVAARGYTPGVTAAVTIRVVDPLFEQNAGPWRIEVAGGQATCSPAEDADAVADARTWAQIWSSLTPPRDAVRTGGLTATPDAVEALEGIFSGPVPWIGDFF